MTEPERFTADDLDRLLDLGYPVMIANDEGGFDVYQRPLAEKPT